MKLNKLKLLLFSLLLCLFTLTPMVDVDAQTFQTTTITSDYGGGLSGSSFSIGDYNTTSSFDIDLTPSGSSSSHMSTDWNTGYWESGSGYYKESGSSGYGSYSTFGSDGSYRTTTIQKSGNTYYITDWDW